MPATVPVPVVEKFSVTIVDRSRRINVLVLDDEPDARDLVAALLSASRATGATAACVADAIEALRSGDFTVLVSGIARPDEDGYVFIRQARARASTRPPWR